MNKQENILWRLVKILWKTFGLLLTLTMIAIISSAIISAIPTLFMQKVLALIEQYAPSGNWDEAKPLIINVISLLAITYAVGILMSIFYNQSLAYITQGFIYTVRKKMFDKMQTLPISYFDRNNDGDIMSHYTNDVDTIRQLISQSIPQLFVSGIVVVTNIMVMLYFSFLMTSVVFFGVLVMYFVVKKIGGNSAKYFVAQQKSLGKLEGFVEEMLSGQKVIKVFNHEDKVIESFNQINDEMAEVSTNANTYANILGPILMNIGNILYVIVAIIGGILLLNHVPNISLSGMAFTISVAVPFLNITKQFVGNINQVSQQINSIIMGVAGAKRIFNLLDEDIENDDGCVTLVRAKEDCGKIIETNNNNDKYYWRYPHQDGSITYTELKGDVILEDVDFAYIKNQTVLHNINVYANSGQKVAFVGATGAGKTTITNLINRFYDIEDGKVKYDGININKIKKADLRKTLGMVLQDTNLFTGTVMDNIRYGRLDATDEECIEAAKMANADDFIRMLPNGYQTIIKDNAANLSQGQRQLLSIARCEVANPPVMILDEATSSIDTHTESLVQKGMDALMEGRTVFVIAHRLSTIMNSDVIMVMENGRIIERGSHESLISNRGTYYQLYTGAFELE